MTTLIVYTGDEEYRLQPSFETTYFYAIGSGHIVGREYIVLNNSQKLNQIAEQVRDEYSEWVYGLNSEFRENGMVREGLSLFFVSDLSCKRTEFFDTFNTICNLLLIKESLKGIVVDSLLLVGTDKTFAASIASLFPEIPADVRNVVRSGSMVPRSVISDIRFGLEIIGIALINALNYRDRKRPLSENKERYFFSIVPKMFTDGGVDKKYVDFVGTTDRYAVSIITDGMHQHVSVLEYSRIRRELPKDKYALIDEHITVADSACFFYWLLIGVRFMAMTQHATYKFMGIDVTAYIRQEKILSCRRASRLITIGRVLKRFFSNHQVAELIYYLHEYPLGRMISYVLGTHFKDVKRIGFQHGPSSWRKLLYFLAKDEGSSHPPFENRAPLPDVVLAEDPQSMAIYRYAGYKDVEQMDLVYRLEYLKSIQPQRDPGYALIAPGLHDGKAMLDALESTIRREKETIFLLCPHPLGNKLYLKNRFNADNIRVSGESVQRLLRKVGKVYVTYSSVGIEARQLGIELCVVDIPGKVDESPLRDRQVRTGL